MGCMHKCKEKQFEFADMMWELYNKQQQNKGENQNGQSNRHGKQFTGT